MAIQKQNKHLLKIFSGPHVGAEMSLRPGKYTIGRGADSDIVLQDELIDEQHLTLTISDDSDTVVRAVGQANVIVGSDGTHYGSDYEVTASPYEMITIGATHFAIGEPGGSWSGVSFPTLYSRQETPPAETAHAGKLRESYDNFDKNLKIVFDNFKKTVAHNDGVVDEDDSDSMVAEEVPLEDQEPPAGSSRKKSIRVIGVVAAALAGIVASLLWGFNGKGDADHTAPEYAMVHMAEGVIEYLGYADVKTESVVDDQVIVQGYVENENEKLRLHDALSEAGLSSVVRVITGSALVQSAKDVLRVLGYPNAVVQYEPTGKIDVRGYIEDRATWRKVKDTLMGDIYGLQGVIDSGMLDFSKRQELLQQKINESKLGRKLLVKSVADRELEVYGVLGPNEMHLWRKIIGQYREDLGNSPPVRSKVHDTRKVIKLDIKSVRVGEVPYLVMLDGSKLLEGGILPNGYKVRKIASDKIVLSKDKLESIYYLGN